MAMWRIKAILFIIAGNFILLMADPSRGLLSSLMGSSHQQGKGPVVMPNTASFQPILNLIHYLEYVVWGLSGVMIFLMAVVGMFQWAYYGGSTSVADETAPAPIDYTGQNKAKVVGWELADPDQLKSLPPADLQAILDRVNPFSDRIAAGEQLLTELTSNTQRTIRRRKKLEERVHQLRRSRVIAAEQAPIEEADRLLRLTRTELREIIPDALQEKVQRLKA
jgi:hypothetical protein